MGSKDGLRENWCEEPRLGREVVGVVYEVPMYNTEPNAIMGNTVMAGRKRLWNKTQDKQFLVENMVAPRLL